jgi:hypothetical protein
MVYHCPASHPRLEVMGEVSYLGSWSFFRREQYRFCVPAPSPTPASPTHTLPRLRAPLPSQFISPHPTPQRVPPLQSPCCPASESEGPSSVPGLLSPRQQPLVRRGGVQVWRSTAVPALGE